MYLTDVWGEHGKVRTGNDGADEAEITGTKEGGAGAEVAVDRVQNLPF